MFIHPLLQHPVTRDELPYHVTITQLERSSSFQEIFNEMKENESGNMTITTEKVFTLQNRVKSVKVGFDREVEGSIPVHVMCCFAPDKALYNNFLCW